MNIVTNSLMGEISDIIKLGDEFIRGYFKEKKSEKEAKYAYILKSAGLLVAVIRNLDESFSDSLKQLFLFSPDWDKEKREKIRENINNFAHSNVRLSKIQEYTKELDEYKHYDVEDSIKETISKLWVCGERTIDAAGKGRTFTPFPNREELHAFLEEIKSADTFEKVKDLSIKADKIRSIFSSEILAQANEAFGELKGQIKKINPYLPLPDWV